jgi:hypothetical protein
MNLYSGMKEIVRRIAAPPAMQFAYPAAFHNGKYDRAQTAGGAIQRIKPIISKIKFTKLVLLAVDFIYFKLLSHLGDALADLLLLVLGKG